MLTIYTPQVTNRIRYVFDLFFTEQLGIKHQVLSNIEEFRAAPEPKVCYDKQGIDDAPCFGAVFLLFEKGVQHQDISISEYDYVKVFFQVYGDDYLLPYDPFAAAFFMVSRYEEYLPFQGDRHGRFPATASLAYRKNFLHIPVVNYYVSHVKAKLLSCFPDMRFSTRHFKFKPSYDIDSAYEYRGKGFVRNMGGLARSVIAGNLGKAVERVRVLSGMQKDPFDTYDFIEGLHAKYDLHAAFFFLVGDYDEYDKSVSVNMSAFRTLIKAVADEAEVGLHPSYASNYDDDKLKKEIRRLSKVLRRDVVQSRQHFLKLKFPETYTRLLEEGIKEDYTMGYADQPGFRAGICSSFYFYNLDEENKTPLKVYPFVVMDATLNYYMNLPPQKAVEVVRPLIEEIKNLDGLLMTLWHNSSFSERDGWEGWKTVYEQLLQIIHE